MIDPLANSWPNPYRDVWHFFKENRLPSERGDWRLTEYELGEVNGLPKSRGRVVATNGLMCYIVIAPDVLYYGHYTAWIPDQIEKDEVKLSSYQPTKKEPKTYAVFADY